MIDIRWILYPTDFSDYSRHAIPYVEEMAKRFGAKALLLHVITLPDFAVQYQIPIDEDSARKTMQKSSEVQLAEIAAQLKEAGVESEIRIVVGTPSVEIVKAARDRAVDLVIIPTHGLGAIKHMIMGSTAERVVQHAPCPLLILRHPEHEFVHP